MQGLPQEKCLRLSLPTKCFTRGTTTRYQLNKARTIDVFRQKIPKILAREKKREIPRREKLAKKEICKCQAKMLPNSFQTRMLKII